MGHGIPSDLQQASFSRLRDPKFRIKLGYTIRGPVFGVIAIRWVPQPMADRL